MAITKILPVRGQLKGCLDYAANPQKTEYFSTADMQRLIGYTQNKDKTEHQLYVSGFNCMPQNCDLVFFQLPGEVLHLRKPLFQHGEGFLFLLSGVQRGGTMSRKSTN